MSADTIPADVWDLATKAAILINPDMLPGEIRTIATTILADRATRPAEPAAPVAEVKAWLLGDPATGQWIEVDGRRVEYSRGMGTPAHVLASAFQAERARADAAEQRAADALARAEKSAEDERDRLYELASNHGGWAVPVVAPGFIRDCGGAMLPHERRAFREAQPATDGGDNG